jgi:hypothetical protein
VDFLPLLSSFFSLHFILIRIKLQVSHQQPFLLQQLDLFAAGST